MSKPLTEAQKIKAKERKLRWRLNNPDKQRASVKAFYKRNPTAHKNNHYINTYNISLQDRNIVLELQGNCCAICMAATPGRKTRSGKNGDWIIDHDHKTGKIRGVVCFKCNVMLGYARDNADILRWAAEYLEQNQ